MQTISNLRFPLMGMLLVLLFTSPTCAWTECYRTPQAAITGTHSDVQLKSDDGGYRIVRVVSDPLLGRSWAIIAYCEHPEWSTLAMPIFKMSSRYITESKTPTDRAPVVVHAGDPVRLWRREALLQIEIAGLSEQNGSVGQTVRVRLFHANNNNPSAPEEFTGVVDGPLDVEMKP